MEKDILNCISNGIIYMKDISNKIDGLKKYLSKEGCSVFIIDEEDSIEDKDSLLQNIYSICHLPEYFGFNWDALEECLNDFSFLPSKGYFFIIPRSTNLKRRISEIEYNNLLGILNDVSCTWKNEGIPFKIILEEQPPASSHIH